LQQEAWYDEKDLKNIKFQTPRGNYLHCNQILRRAQRRNYAFQTPRGNYLHCNLAELESAVADLKGFKPLAGITCIATKKRRKMHEKNKAGFKPLAGITCIATWPSMAQEACN